MNRPTAAIVALTLLTAVALGCDVDEAPHALPALEAETSPEPGAIRPQRAFSRDMERAIDRLTPADGWPSREEFVAARDQGPAKQLLECEQTTYTDEDGGVQTTGPALLGERDGVWHVLAHSKVPPGPGPSQGGARNAIDVDIHGGVTWSCEGARRHTIQLNDEASDASVYATVMTTPEEPTFVPPRTEEAPPAPQRFDAPLTTPADDVQQEIAELIASGPPSGAGTWAGALRRAKENNRPDLAYEVYRRYRPVGRCSQDTKPLSTKEDFANTCAAIGRPRCHLALTADLLAYRIERRSDLWLNGLPTSYESRLDMLPEVVDPQLFLLGLLVDTQLSRRGISANFFAAVAVKSSHREALAETLREWIADEEIDAWNKHRFAMALFGLPHRPSRSQRSDIS